MKTKNLILLIALIVSTAIISCKKSGEESAEGMDVNAKRELLKSKESQLFQLQAEIQQLKFELDSIDPQTDNITTVTTFKIEKTDFNRYTEIQGSVEADEIVKVSSEIGGRLLSLNVENGDRVSKGQLLAKVDIESLSKQMEELEKTHELALEVYERQKRLWEQNIGSEIQYLNAKNNKERLEKSIESLKVQLRKSNIYSPISGVIDNKFAEPGEMILPGFTFMQILNTKSLKIYADVPENYLSSVHRGDKIKVQIPTLDFETDVKINKIGNTINETNRTFSIEAKIDNFKGMLKPNLNATILINDLNEKDVIVVPSNLIQFEINGNPYIMKAVMKDNKYMAEKVHITYGEQYDGKTIISDGLSSGDLIINKGAKSLSNGDFIELDSLNINTPK